MDNITINVNSVWENLTFNVQNIWWISFACNFVAQRGWAWFCEHVHPNFMILTIFRPLFYETFSSFGQHQWINFNSVEENLTFNVQNIFVRCTAWRASEHVHPCATGHGSVTIFRPLFYRNLSAALDSKRINLNSVEENLTFNALFWKSMHGNWRAGHGSVHVHPNLAGWFFTIFRPLFYETFSSFGQHKNQF